MHTNFSLQSIAFYYLFNFRCLFVRRYRRRIVQKLSIWIFFDSAWNATTTHKCVLFGPHGAAVSTCKLADWRRPLQPTVRSHAHFILALFSLLLFVFVFYTDTSAVMLSKNKKRVVFAIFFYLFISDNGNAHCLGYGRAPPPVQGREFIGPGSTGRRRRRRDRLPASTPCPVERGERQPTRQPNVILRNITTIARLTYYAYRLGCV